MNKEVSVLKLSQDGNVQCYKWYDEIRSPIGVVLICHGMGEHIERYVEFVEKLTKAGYVVYGHNQRGHQGSIKSKDDYGYINAKDGFDLLVSDLYAISEMIKVTYPKLPIFIVGHSMGSFVTQRFAQLHGKMLKGIILSGSSKQPKGLLNFAVMLSKTIYRLKGPHHRSKLIYKLTFDSYNKHFKPNRTKFDWLNRDEKEVDKYANDEYCGGVFTTRFYKDFFIGLKNLSVNFELVPKDLPIYIISGSEDPVGGCSKQVTNLYKYYQSLDIKDLEFKLYDGARHEIFLEINKDEVMNDCISWLNKHLK